MKSTENKPLAIHNTDQVNRLAQELGDTLARGRGTMDDEILLSVAVQMVADYARLWKGDAYLTNLAQLVIMRKQVQMPLVTPGGEVKYN